MQCTSYVCWYPWQQISCEQKHAGEFKQVLVETTNWYTVEPVYNVLFCVIITSVVITEEYNVMVNSEELWCFADRASSV